jgi:hypothetical protein
MNQGFGAASDAPIPPPRLVVEEADSDPATSPSRQPKAVRNRTRAIARNRVALSHERGFALSHVALTWRDRTWSRGLRPGDLFGGGFVWPKSAHFAPAYKARRGGAKARRSITMARLTAKCKSMRQSSR